MPYLIGSIPFFRVHVRKEYTRNLEDGHGEWLEGEAVWVRCVRGHSLMFQVVLDSGASFKLPIEALAWKPCDLPPSMDHVQPWDCASSDFGVEACSFLARGAMLVLPGKVKAQYRFTVDFTGSDLADDAKQGKALHVCFVEDGSIGAFPNNRVLWVDPAFRDEPKVEELPKLKSLAHEFRAEGFQEVFGSRQRTHVPAVAEKVTPAFAPASPLRSAFHTDPAERADWVTTAEGDASGVASAGSNGAARA